MLDTCFRYLARFSIDVFTVAITILRTFYHVTAFVASFTAHSNILCVTLKLKFRYHETLVLLLQPTVLYMFPIKGGSNKSLSLNLN